MRLLKFFFILLILPVSIGWWLGKKMNNFNRPIERVIGYGTVSYVERMACVAFTLALTYGAVLAGVGKVLANENVQTVLAFVGVN